MNWILHHCLRLLLIGILTIYSGQASAQSGDKFVPIQAEDGLEDLTITGVIEGLNGYMWFTTKNGLHRYDGYEFKVFTHDPADENSLSSSIILCTVQDEDGYLWLGTEADGLNRFDPVSEEVIRYHHVEGDDETLLSDQIYSLSFDHNGYLWIGTYDAGVSRLDISTGEFNHYPIGPMDGTHITEGPIWSIVETGDHHIWISTWGGGLNELDPTTDKVTYYVHSEDDPGSISDNMVGPLFEDASGYLWATTWSAGLEKLDRHTGTFEHFNTANSDISSNVLWALTPAPGGKIWVGTYEKGLDLFDPDKRTFRNWRYNPSYPKRFIHNNIWSLYTDHTGILWIGTEGGGIMKHSGIKKNFLTIIPEAPEDSSHISEMIRSLAADDHGNLWIGTWYYGLKKRDKHGNITKYFRDDLTSSEQVGANQIRALYVDSEGHLWIGSNRQGASQLYIETDSIVDHFHDEDDPNTITHNNIRTICETSDGHIWIGTSRGLNRYDHTTGDFTRYMEGGKRGLTDDHINGLTASENGNLWVGTDHGVLYYVASTDRFTEVGSSKTFSHNTIHTLHEDTDGILWVGTRRGLDRYDPETGRSAHFRIRKLSSENHINAIIDDGSGHLWLSTNHGLLQFDKQSESFSLYDSNEGLKVLGYSQNAACTDNTGNIYFGGTGGVTAFHPSRVQSNPYAPKVMIQQIIVDGQYVGESASMLTLDKVEIDYAHNSFTAKFVGFSYNDPAKTRYAYLLDGYNDDWVYTGTGREAQFNNLPPGRYELRIKASNEDGRWSDVYSVTIIILKPFWQQWWFYVSCFVGVAILIFIAVKLRERKLKKEKRELESLVAERTSEVVKQKEIILEKNLELTDSINYAKGIQDSMLPASERLRSSFTDSFVLYLPKDIVSGDFYWMAETDGNVFAAVVDCTGHGVPGAFVSMVGSNGLDRSVNEYDLRNTGDILDQLSQLVETSFRNRKDGMDLSMIRKQSTGDMIQYSGAQNPLYVVRDGDTSLKVDGKELEPKNESGTRKLYEVKADKQPVGAFAERKPFSTKQVAVQAGDTLYLFSDGFPDQFGGKKGKKFKYSTFRKLLLEIAHEPMEKQQAQLKTAFVRWKGNFEQLDDICIMGIRI